MLTDYQIKISSAVECADIVEPPSPWKKLVSDWLEVSLGAIGFTKDQRFLICTDGAYRWYYNLETGALHECDENSTPEIYWDSKIWNHPELTLKGFGEKREVEVKTSGIYGYAGGFFTQTEDGWKISQFTQPYFENSFLLQSPEQSAFCAKPTFSKIHSSATTHIAHGFTPNGQNLVVADRDQILVYSRSGA